MIGKQVDHAVGCDLMPYKRGVSLREIVKGTVARFLPGSLITVFGAVSFLGVSISGDVLAVVGGLLGLAGALTVGFGLGLLGLRHWLYPDAKLDGPRSFIAGLMSPLALFIAVTMSQGWGTAQLAFGLVLVGIVMAVGMFFAWLTPTPEAMRGDGFEPDSLDPLPELAERALLETDRSG